MNENLVNQIVNVLLRDGSVPMTAEELAGYVSPVVSGLSKDYDFKGVVNPMNSPGFITSPTAVVACTGGTYRGYSSIVLDQFTIALFVSDDGAVWEKKEIFNAIKKMVESAAAGEVETQVPETGMQPRIYYDLGDINVDTNFTLGENIEGIEHYYFGFNTGEVVPEITWPTQVLAWADDKAPEIAANKHYEISILNGVGAWLESSIPTPASAAEPLA